MKLLLLMTLSMFAAGAAFGAIIFEPPPDQTGTSEPATAPSDPPPDPGFISFGPFGETSPLISDPGIGPAPAPEVIFIGFGPDPVDAPEPGTFVLMGAGLAGLAMVRRRVRS